MADIDLNSPEVKEAIKTAVEEATHGLVAKRDELLREVKDLRKGKALDPADVDKLENEIDALKGELSKAQKTAQKATKDAETYKQSLESEQSAVRNLLVETGLTDALTKQGVTNPVLLKAAKQMLAGSVKLEQDGDIRVARLGEKPLADAIKEWAGGDEGKHFVTAQQNSGGGAAGGSGTGGATPTMTRAQFDALVPAKKAETMRLGITLTE
jgi:outer membrane murein-binding lipoprotein Lpp/acylphosphatase